MERADSLPPSRTARVQAATIRSNLVCNERCGFCHARADQDDPLRFSQRAVTDAALQALANGARTITFSGGEPLLRDDLANIVATVVAAGAREVVVETNGLLLAYPRRARELASVGLTHVRVALNAWGDHSDRIVQRDGAFELTCQGIAHALSNGLKVEVSCALHADNLGVAPALPGKIARRFDGIHGLLLNLVTTAPQQYLAPLESLLGAAQAVIDGCREVGMRCEVAASSALSPCLVRRRRQYPELLRSLHTDHGGERVRIEACEHCEVSTICGGVRAELLGLPGTLSAAPITAADERFVRVAGGDRRALVAQQLLSSGHFVKDDGTVGDERVLRINYHCNQDCGFCFVDRTRSGVGKARILSEIEQAAQDGVDLLSISGGEPTLSPQLRVYVARAVHLGLRVQLQTNAVALDDPQMTQDLADAGLAEAFVSLHAGTATVSDAITRRPGTFERTLRGVDNLLASGIAVRLNCVITGANVGSLQALPQLVATRFRNAPELVLSWASASTNLVPIDADITPKISEAVPALLQLVSSCAALAVRWRGLEGECGVPLCTLPDRLLALRRVPQRPSREPPAGFIKPPVCSTCTLDSKCPGLRETYAQLHGVDELRPVANPG